MNKKTISIIDFNQYTTKETEPYLNMYGHLPQIIKTISSKFKKMEFNLITPSDVIMKNIKDGVMSKTFSINLGTTTFDDSQFYKGLPDNLNKKMNYMIMIDAIIGNLIYYLLGYNKSRAQYYIDNFTILSIYYQKVIFKSLVKKIYASSSKEDTLDNVMIITTYSIYRFMYDYSHEMAKTTAIDLLMNSEILDNDKMSRIDISIKMNNLVRTNKSKNLYDALYNGGLFTEFVTAKKFLISLANIYDIRLIKTLFTNYKFNYQYDKIGFYIYKIVTITISDSLQSWKQYSRFKSSLSSEFRTSKLLIEEMIKDTSTVLNKLGY